MLLLLQDESYDDDDGFIDSGIAMHEAFDDDEEVS